MLYIFQCLILSNCQWFTPHSLLVISKMPNLKELRLNSCHRLGECVAYAGLATRFGFKTLEVKRFEYLYYLFNVCVLKEVFIFHYLFQILDLRDTALGDSEVGFFSYTKTLTHLYLECPSSLRNPESADRSRTTTPTKRSVESTCLRGWKSCASEYMDDKNDAKCTISYSISTYTFLFQFLVEDEFRWDNYTFGRCLVTDRAICALGSDTCIHNSEDGVLVVKENKRVFNNPNLKTLVVRYDIMQVLNLIVNEKKEENKDDNSRNVSEIIHMSQIRVLYIWL